MPVYTYKCTSCDHQFEARQRFSDDPLTECPVCGSLIRKVIMPVGIVFKGSGFYVTDNKNGKASSSSLNNGTGPSAKTKEGETTGKSEKSDSTAASKPASSSESASAA